MRRTLKSCRYFLYTASITVTFLMIKFTFTHAHPVTTLHNVMIAMRTLQPLKSYHWSSSIAFSNSNIIDTRYTSHSNAVHNMAYSVILLDWSLKVTIKSYMMSLKMISSDVVGPFVGVFRQSDISWLQRHTNHKDNSIATWKTTIN